MGISVCDEWYNDFRAFEEWALRSGYEKHLEIDRINGLGNYEPSNCRWVTRKQNANNKSNTIMATAFGETKSVSEWGDDERCLVPVAALIWRIRHGKWDHETAMTHPSGIRRKYSNTKNAARHRARRVATISH
jgi:hypothetical protein